MFTPAVILSATILTGSLVGSLVSFVRDWRTASRARRAVEPDYRNLFGPGFSKHRVRPSRVTFVTSKVQEELARQKAEEGMKIAA